MLGAIRAASSRSSVRVGSPPCLFEAQNLIFIFQKAFSSSAPRAADLAKLILIGHLARDPESRQTKNDREFVTFAQLLTLRLQYVSYTCSYPGIQLPRKTTRLLRRMPTVVCY